MVVEVEKVEAGMVVEATVVVEVLVEVEKAEVGMVVEAKVAVVVGKVEDTDSEEAGWEAVEVAGKVEDTDLEEAGWEVAEVERTPLTQ
mmetsp:Transcript_11481/g.23993  ORF Transcript_11481/g.23993 Transcript_11481/m.23993 type:complete len:88 (+) Transcript_11481:177-440(+)